MNFIGCPVWHKDGKELLNTKVRRLSERLAIRQSWLAVMVLLLGVLCLAGQARADTFAIGLVSFDVLVAPEGDQPGVNGITILNLTGADAIPPDFPVTTELLFEDIALTIFTPGGSQLLSLGSLGPGAYPNDSSLKFASDVIINSIVLAATFSPITFDVDGVGTRTANSGSIFFVLSPSLGDALEAGVDLGFFSADTGELAPIPEPSLGLGVVAALAGFALLRRHRREC